MADDQKRLFWFALYFNFRGGRFIRKSIVDIPLGKAPRLGMRLSI